MKGADGSPVGAESSRKCIYFVINSLGAGGAEKQVLLLASALADIGYRCTLITLEQRTQSKQLAALVEDCQAKEVQIEYPAGGGRTWQFARLACRLAGIRSGVIWAWGSRAEMLLKSLTRKRREVLYLSSLRLACSDAIAHRKRIYCFRRKFFDAYVSNSQINIEKFKCVTRLREMTFHVLHNVVPDVAGDKLWQARPQPLSGLRVALLGNNRFIHKGYDTLLEVARCVKASRRDISFSVAGIDYDQDMERRIFEFGVADVVKYVGHIDEPNSFLQKNDAFLLTSRVEGMPNALLEALRIGMPAVSTAVGDIGDFMPHERVLRLCEVGDANAIFEELCYLQDNYDAAVQMGRYASVFVTERLGVDRICRDLVGILTGSRQADC